MRRAARSLVPPFLLLLAIGGWYWLSHLTEVAPVEPVTATPRPPVLTEMASQVAAETATSAPQGLVGLATPWGAAGLEPTATPTVVAVVPGSITLFGPPLGSRFATADEVSFYWSWPGALTEGQQFVLYLVTAGGRRPLGQLNEANLGQIYHLSRSVGEAGDYRWEVVLEDGVTGAIIGRSESRPLTVVGG